MAHWSRARAEPPLTDMVIPYGSGLSARCPDLGARHGRWCRARRVPQPLRSRVPRLAAARRNRRYVAHTHAEHRPGARAPEDRSSGWGHRSRRLCDGCLRKCYVSSTIRAPTTASAIRFTQHWSIGFRARCNLEGRASASLQIPRATPWRLRPCAATRRSRDAGSPCAARARPVAVAQMHVTVGALPVAVLLPVLAGQRRDVERRAREIPEVSPGSPRGHRDTAGCSQAYCLRSPRPLRPVISLHRAAPQMLASRPM